MIVLARVGQSYSIHDVTEIAVYVLMHAYPCATTALSSHLCCIDIDLQKATMLQAIAQRRPRLYRAYDGLR